MEIHHANELGTLLIEALAIKPNNRVNLQFDHSNRLVTIWDLDAENLFTVAADGSHKTSRRVPLPEPIKLIIASSDADLKKRWQEGSMDGWSGERETIFTELCFRGVNMLSRI